MDVRCDNYLSNYFLVADHRDPDVTNFLCVSVFRHRSNVPVNKGPLKANVEVDMQMCVFSVRLASVLKPAAFT